MKRIEIIGLTGQTGAGKSTVSEYFKNKGFAVINADSLVREIYTVGSPCVKTLSAIYGSDILDCDGLIIRSLLANRAFSSKESTAMLNSIVHPFVTALLLKKAKEACSNGYTKLIYDAPQLFESNTDIICTTVISVTADKATRLSRICKRDGINESAALQRIDSQLSENFFKINSDYIIINNSDLHTLNKQIEAVYNSICSRGD